MQEHNRGKVTIAVASRNPNKVRGVRKAAAKLFGRGAKVVAIDVDSGVSEQPFNGETINGAINRAKAVAREVEGCDYAVGLESGIFEIGGRFFDVQWCAVIHGSKTHIGCSMGFEIPRKEAERLKARKITLSELYYEVTGDRDIGIKEGVIGHLSGGVLKRSMMSEQAFLCAMIPMMKKIRK